MEESKIKVKSRGTLINDDFVIDKNEEKLLPANWKSRSGLVDSLKGSNPMLKIVSKHEEVQFIEDFEATDKKEDQREPINLTRGAKLKEMIEKKEARKQAIAEEKAKKLKRERKTQK